MVSERERVLGAAVNVSAIFFPYAGPIVGAVLCSKSSFVKFHAYRALLDQIIETVVIGSLMIASLTYTIYTTVHTMQDGFDLSKIDWVAILLKSAITWLLFALWGVVNTILSIRDALSALRGTIPTKPNWGERSALKLSGLGSNIRSTPVIEQA